MPDTQNGQDPRHPPSTYQAKYPMNRVTVTESGHEVHYDDTPGKERIRIAHRKGTYTEINEKGKRTELTVDNLIQYVKGGFTHTSDKNYDEKVGGSHRSNISGDKHAEIKGTYSFAVGGHYKKTVGEDYVMAVKGDHVTGTAGNHRHKIGGDSNTKVDGKLHTIVDGETQMEHGDTVTFSSISKIVFKVGDNASITMEDGKITLKATQIITDGDTYLGSPNANKLVSGKGTIDTGGFVDSGPVSRNVYIEFGS